MPSLTTFALTALLVIFGSTVSGMAGFGFGIATMPFMLLLFPPKVAVALTPSITFFGLFLQFLRVRRDMDKRLAGNLILGAIFGIPIGAVILRVINPADLKVLIGVAVVVAIAVQLTKGRGDGSPNMPGGWLTRATGFVAGLLASTVGQPGIATGLLMTWSRLDKKVVRATIVAFLLATQVFSVANLMWQKVLTLPTLWTGLALMPFYLIGLSIGNKSFHLASQVAYRRILLGVLTVSAITGVVNGVTALLH